MADLPADVLQDPTFLRSGGGQKGRDGCRVPLPWAAARADARLRRPARAPAGPGRLRPLRRREPGGRRGLHPELLPAGARRDGGDCRPARRWTGSRPCRPTVVAFTRPGGWTSVTNFGSTPVPMPAGTVIVSSSPLEGRERAPGDDRLAAAERPDTTTDHDGRVLRHPSDGGGRPCRQVTSTNGGEGMTSQHTPHVGRAEPTRIPRRHRGRGRRPRARGVRSELGRLQGHRDRLLPVEARGDRVLRRRSSSSSTRPSPACGCATTPRRTWPARSCGSPRPTSAASTTTSRSRATSSVARSATSATCPRPAGSSTTSSRSSTSPPRTRTAPASSRTRSWRRPCSTTGRSSPQNGLTPPTTWDELHRRCATRSPRRASPRSTARSRTRGRSRRATSTTRSAARSTRPKFFNQLKRQGTNVGPDSPVSFEKQFLEPVEADAGVRPVLPRQRGEPRLRGREPRVRERRGRHVPAGSVGDRGDREVEPGPRRRCVPAADDERPARPQGAGQHRPRAVDPGGLRQEGGGTRVPVLPHAARGHRRLQRARPRLRRDQGRGTGDQRRRWSS